ncbi:type III effector [Pseudomonas amygdali pv. morsprunorum]|nr:type III effector [Pseudomonas amygdali pv. morsprunorum]KAA3532728.1 type III effector [Pseudomonas savastanoi]MBA4706306.1 type III effector [Pseudomonas savastanoi pv. savastanoi]TSC26455.1 type III effector [Pseudomonas sp. ST1]POY79731.1 type III effector [Pseudomonas amygdali pv. morsprunorum]
MYSPPVSPRNVSGSSTPAYSAGGQDLASASHLSEEAREDFLTRAAADVYHDSRLWHGTSGSYLQELRDYGFQRRRSGAVDASIRAGYELNPDVVKNTEKHNYFTSYPVSAKKYARRTDPDNPVLVRTIGIKNNFRIELDPDSKGPDGEIYQYNCRTTSSIPSKFVIGSKHSAPKNDAKIFKKEMGEAGYNVSLEQAGRLLREVQSDSDDDF